MYQGRQIHNGCYEFKCCVHSCCYKTIKLYYTAHAYGGSFVDVLYYSFFWKCFFNTWIAINSVISRYLCSNMDMMTEWVRKRERRSEPDRKREKKEETGRAKKSALVSLHKFCFSAFRTNDVSFVSDETASNQRCFAACTNEAIIVPMSVFKWNKTCATNTWSHKIIHQIKKTKNKINLNISKRNHQM